MQLLDERLKDCVGTVLVKLDTDLSPKFIGKIIKLPARRYRQKQYFGLPWKIISIGMRDWAYRS